MHLVKNIICTIAAVAIIALGSATFVAAYDGTKCSEPGVCWEAKPGYPAKVKGSKYDPKHNPSELGKQSASITQMEMRNAKRVACFKKTGKFEFDVDKLSC